MKIISAGDIVLHKPSGETWVVCGINDDRIIPCGYPFPSVAELSDCTLTDKGTGQTDEMKRALLGCGLNSFIEGAEL